jgi:hypothetical protein
MRQSRKYFTHGRNFDNLFDRLRAPRQRPPGHGIFKMKKLFLSELETREEISLDKSSLRCENAGVLRVFSAKTAFTAATQIHEGGCV